MFLALFVLTRIFGEQTRPLRLLVLLSISFFGSTPFPRSLLLSSSIPSVKVQTIPLFVLFSLPVAYRCLLLSTLPLPLPLTLDVFVLKATVLFSGADFFVSLTPFPFPFNFFGVALTLDIADIEMMRVIRIVANLAVRAPFATPRLFTRRDPGIERTKDGGDSAHAVALRWRILGGRWWSLPEHIGEGHRRGRDGALVAPWWRWCVVYGFGERRGERRRHRRGRTGRQRQRAKRGRARRGDHWRMRVREGAGGVVALEGGVVDELPIFVSAAADAVVAVVVVVGDDLRVALLLAYGALLVLATVMMAILREDGRRGVVRQSTLLLLLLLRLNKGIWWMLLMLLLLVVSTREVLVCGSRRDSLCLRAKELLHDLVVRKGVRVPGHGRCGERAEICLSAGPQP